MTDDNFRYLFNQAIGMNRNTDCGATELYRFYKSYILAGFSEEQAMAILLTMIKTAIMKGD